MIDEVVAGFAKGARMLEQSGMQGVEVHAGHNYLAQQFLQPATNKREDDYGGSLENRARFLIEVLTAIRAETSKAFVLGVRMGDSKTSDASDADEVGQVLAMLQSRGLIDFLDASHAGYYAMGKCIAGMDRVVGYQLEQNAPIRQAANVPVLAIGRFRTLEEADQSIRAGDADMIGMTRATIADPDIVNKSLAGRAEEVRPCIGCLQDCLGKLMTAHRIGCVVNPAVSFESQLAEEELPPANVPRRVVVVGGGPSGMEAARIAALRGHDVVLFEAEPKLGGALKVAARAPSRDGIADIAYWLESEIYRLGVDVRLSSYVDEDDIAAEKPDAVIVAAGSTARLDGVLAPFPGSPISGMTHRSVTSSVDIMSSPPPPSDTDVVVIDDIGHYEAIAVSEWLIGHGCNVTMLTRHVAFAPYLENTFQNDAHLSRLTKTGHFRFVSRTRALEISDMGVSTIPTFQDRGGNGGHVFLADRVVVITANAANSALQLPLQERGFETHLSGDALSPRFLGAAIQDGRKIAMAV